jgi:predicted CoA-binding protein
MTTSDAIETFLAQPAIAVVGVSRCGSKFGNAAFRTLRDKGYHVYQIHRLAEAIGGTRCYSRLTDTPEKVSAVFVSVPLREALGVIRDAADAGIRHVWLQPGAESPEAIALCARLDIDVVAGECILMFASPTGFHQLHRLVRRITGALPA